MDGGCTHGAEKAHGTAPGTAADSSRAKLQTGGRECRIKILPYSAKFGRIKANRKCGSGAAIKRWTVWPSDTDFPHRVRDVS